MGSLPPHWRHSARLTQALMAALIGCSERQYRRLEQGTGPVGLDIVAATARILALSEAERAALYAWAGHRPPAITGSAATASLVRSLADRPDVGLLILGADLRVLRVHVDPQRFGGLRIPEGARFTDLVPAEDAQRLRHRLGAVLDTGEPELSTTERVALGNGLGSVSVSVSALPLQEVEGLDLLEPSLMVTLVNVSTDQHTRTQERRAQRYLDLVAGAGMHIGTSLDPAETARQLADTLLPLAGPGGMTVVHLAAEVFTGGDSPLRRGGGVIELQCAARANAGTPWSPDFIAPGQSIHVLPDTVSVRLHQQGSYNILPDRAVIYAGLANDPEQIRLLVPDLGTGPLAFASIPIVSPDHGVTGAAQLWRVSGQFSGDDVQVATRVVARAAVAVDLCRQHAGALRTITSLRRQLAGRAPRGPRPLGRRARWDRTACAARWKGRPPRTRLHEYRRPG